WWSGGHGGVVGVGDGEGAVVVEVEGPVVVVDLVVVFGAEGEEVVEVGVASVAPPGDVVDGAVVVVGGAVGDGAGGVEGLQGAALGAVGEAGGALQVEFAGGVEDGSVADDDWVGVAAVEQVA
ncbi:MAG: hypothetical protein FD127_4473, partial [Acidimicrobiaceae bacterium]